MEQDTKKLLAKIDLRIAKTLKPYGHRFGYVLLVTENRGDGNPETHMQHNGYAPTRDAPEAMTAVLGILETMVRFIRTGKVAP